MDDSERVIRELSECPAVEGVTMMDILELPDPVRVTLKEMVRSGPLTYDEIRERLDMGADMTDLIIGLLVEKGYVQAVDAGGDEPIYRVALAPIRGRPIGDDL